LNDSYLLSLPKKDITLGFLPRWKLNFLLSFFQHFLVVVRSISTYGERVGQIRGSGRAGLTDAGKFFVASTITTMPWCS
jgi:hypothetical protein